MLEMCNDQSSEYKVSVQTEEQNSTTTTKNNKKYERFELLWMDISNFGEPAKFIMCSITVLSLFIITGYILEYIFLYPGFKPFSWFFTFLQFCLFSLISVFEILLRKIPRSTVSLKMYMILALVILGSFGFTNASLEYLNYPAHVMFKTCNQIPVMIGGIIILKKRYKLLDYISVLSMCIGLVWFTLANYQTVPDFSMLGVIMICCALVCNAFLGNFQEKIMAMNDVHNVEIFLFSSFFAAIYSFIGLVVTDTLLSAFCFCSKHPIIYVHIVVISCLGYVGNLAVLTLVKNYDALTAVTVTTCRKALSIVLSFMVFTKPFHLTYIWSGLLVIIGIYLNVISKAGKSVGTNNIKTAIKSFTCRKSYNVRETPQSSSTHVGL